MGQSDKEVLRLYQLIGAPLLAVVQAEAQAAQVSASFIQDIGFTRVKPSRASGVEAAAAEATAPIGTVQSGGDIGDLKMLQFNHQVRSTDGIVRTHQMNVPVLSLFPIPLLQVKDAEFDFTIRILDHESRGPQPRTDPTAAAVQDDGLSDFLSMNRVELKGAIGRQAPTSAQRTTDVQVNVKIRMEQADVPVGLLKLLTVLDQNVTSLPVPAAAVPPGAPAAEGTG